MSQKLITVIQLITSNHIGVCESFIYIQLTQAARMNATNVTTYLISYAVFLVLTGFIIQQAI